MRKESHYASGLVGAGKFGAMYLAQVPKTPGLHLAGIADLSPANAKANLQRVGWIPERYAAVYNTWLFGVGGPLFLLGVFAPALTPITATSVTHSRRPTIIEECRSNKASLKGRQA